MGAERGSAVPGSGRGDNGLSNLATFEVVRAAAGPSGEILTDGRAGVGTDLPPFRRRLRSSRRRVECRLRVRGDAVSQTRDPGGAARCSGQKGVGIRADRPAGGVTVRFQRGLVRIGAIGSVLLALVTPAHSSFCYFGEVEPPEGVLPYGVVGQPYYQQFEIWAQGVFCLEWSINAVPPGLQFNPTSTGAWLDGTPGRVGTFFFSISVSPPFPCGCEFLSAFSSYTLEIRDVCGIASTGGLPGGVLNQPYQASVAVDGGVPPYRFSLVAGPLPSGLVMTSWGVVQGTPREVGSFPLTVEVVDSTGCGFSFPLVLDVACPLIFVIPPSVPAANEGMTYAQQLGVTGGLPPHRYSLESGGLPPGLTLSPSGLIAGTAQLPGSFGFRVLAEDSIGCTARRNYQLDVCRQAALDPPSLPLATRGTPYAHQLTFSGGVPPVNFSVDSGALPAGITLSASGALSGTPQVTQSSGFEVLAVDANGCAARRDYGLVVEGRADVLVGQGSAGANPNVAGIRQASGGLGVDFTAYGAGSWGVEVAAGRFLSPLVDSVVTGPGPGPVLGPHVRGFDERGASIARVSFFAYGTHLWGVHPGAADVDGDGQSELPTGAGSGAVFGPHVRGFDVDGGSRPSAIAGINFFAYSTLKFGVQVGGGDVDGDGRAELITAPGPGAAFGSTIRGWLNRPPIQPMTNIAFNPFAGARYGAEVTSGDVNDDGADDILVGRGPGSTESAQVRGFLVGGSGVQWLTGLDVTPFATAYGVSVGAEDLDGDRRSDLLVGAGPDPAATTTVLWLGYSGTGLTPPYVLGEVYLGARFGLNVSAGNFDY